MIIIPIIMVLISSVLAAYGQLQFKLSTIHKKKNKKNKINKNLIKGLILYGISAVLFIVALKYGKLTTLYPLVSTSFIWTIILAKKHLKEEINTYKYIGITLIIIGTPLIF